ncbi:MAG: 5-oxoprolinase subunit PxpA [Pyrinomonadaceae bacterium]
MKMSIDLNCDLGEGCGNDAELMPLISSANIACGYHAGDADTMKRTVDLALECGVAIGAHPGYADRENFGRTEMKLPDSEIGEIVTDQIAKLADIAEAARGRISHVKPHGALYNRSARDQHLATVIAEAVKSFDPELVLFGLAGSHSIVEAQRIGLKTASEVFADRTYQTDGSLTPRSQKDALIKDENDAVEQVLDMIKYGRVRSTEAIMMRVIAETLCVHGDGARPVEFASLIRRSLEDLGVSIKPPG